MKGNEFVLVDRFAFIRHSSPVIRHLAAGGGPFHNRHHVVSSRPNSSHQRSSISLSCLNVPSRVTPAGGGTNSRNRSNTLDRSRGSSRERRCHRVKASGFCASARTIPSASARSSTERASKWSFV